MLSFCVLLIRLSNTYKFGIFCKSWCCLISSLFVSRDFLMKLNRKKYILTGTLIIVRTENEDGKPSAKKAFILLSLNGDHSDIQVIMDRNSKIQTIIFLKGKKKNFLFAKQEMESHFLSIKL